MDIGAEVQTQGNRLHRTRRFKSRANISVIPGSDDSVILARIQSLARQLGANTRGSEAYNKVHAEFEVLIKTFGRRGSGANPR